MSSPQTDSPVVLGKIVGHYGVHGRVKLVSFTRPASGIAGYRGWFLLPQEASKTRDNLGAHRRVLHVGQSGKSLTAKLHGCDSREDAEALIGLHIAVPRAQLKTPAAGEYYWADLLGLEVVNTEGVILGELIDLLETGANDCLVVKTAKATELLIPWSPDAIVKVDLPAGQLRVRWDENF